MRFSARLSSSQRTLVIDDAPKALRVGFIKRILDRFMGDPPSRGMAALPLETHATHLEFIALIREESEPWDFDDRSTWGAITHHLKECKWEEFYDFVELVGQLLIAKDDDVPFDSHQHFSDYRSAVNSLLREDAIGWSLNSKSELVRAQPAVIEEKLTGTELLLGKANKNAKVHYQKAKAYLYRHPIDEANSVKEIVSAVESIARVLEPGASTLGDALKKLKKKGDVPMLLLDSLEKLYAYSNDAALVRHGHAEGNRPTVREAELCMLCGTAFIRYFIEMVHLGDASATTKKDIRPDR